MRNKYSREEKLAAVKDFAKSGLGKYEYVRKHPEYKRTTLLQWIQSYLPETFECLMRYQKIVANIKRLYSKTNGKVLINITKKL